MTKRKIKTIVKAAEEAINYAQNNKELFVHDPINWGDLGVISIREVTEYFPYTIWKDKSNKYVEVLIEEASPECYEFNRTIEDIIFKLTGIKVNVITEW